MSVKMLADDMASQNIKSLTSGCTKFSHLNSLGYGTFLAQ